MKAGKIIGLFMVMLLAMSSLVAAVENSRYGSLPVSIVSVKVDGDEIYTSSVNIINKERNNEMNVKVVVTNTGSTTLKDMQIEAYMRGYDHNDLIEDITDCFDMKPGISYSKTLKLKLADRMDKGRYLLRIRIEGKADGSFYQDYQIEIDSSRHSLEIKDVILSPDSEVEAGRALLASVRIKNVGQKDEESIKVKVSIPELGITASDYIDEIEADDATTSEELYLRIPEKAKSGSYDVVTEVIYDEGDEKVTKKSSINVVGIQSAKESSVAETVISIGAQSQSVGKGASGAIYPVTISNNGASSKTFIISVDGVESFGSYRISPSNAVVVGAGQVETVYVYVSASPDAKKGDYLFSINVESDAKNIRQVPIKVSIDNDKSGVAEKKVSTLKSGLFYGLIALLVILVIIGLIIGFNKLKNEEDEEDDETSEEKAQTYY